MARFDNLFVKFALVGLLIVSLFAFVITLQEDNNAPEKLVDDTRFNSTFSSLKSDLTAFRDQSNLQKELFESESPTVTFGSLVLFTIVSSGRVFTGMTIGVFNLFIGLPMILFGVDPVISSVLSTILIVVIIIGLWSLYKLGG